MAKAKSAVPEGLHTVTPQLTLDNAAQAIDWYKKALGAEEISRALGPDGKIMHAELRIGDSRIMLNDAMGGGKGPKALGGSPGRSGSTWPTATRCSTAPWRPAAGRARPDGPDDGSVLGRPLRHVHRPARLSLDDRHAQGRSLARGDAAAAGEWMKQFAPQPRTARPGTARPPILGGECRGPESGG